MVLKTISGKSVEFNFDKEIRTTIVNHDVSQIDIAEYEGCFGQSVYQSAYNRLKRLSHEKARVLQAS